MNKDLSKLEKTCEKIIKCHKEKPSVDYKIVQMLHQLSEKEKEKLLTQIIPNLISNRSL